MGCSYVAVVGCFLSAANVYFFSLFFVIWISLATALFIGHPLTLGKVFVESPQTFLFAVLLDGVP